MLGSVLPPHLILCLGKYKIMTIVGLFLPSHIRLLLHCQPQAKAKAKAMPGRLYIHAKNNNK